MKQSLIIIYSAILILVIAALLIGGGSLLSEGINISINSNEFRLDDSGFICNNRTAECFADCRSNRKVAAKIQRNKSRSC